MTEHEMQSLRENIKKKYEAYRLAKPGKYPVLKFNSYSIPYEHLRASFQEELIGHGQADMQEALANIPSVKVLAKIFHEGYVLKDEKLLNTCYLYIWGKPRELILEVNNTVVVPPQPQPTASTQEAIVNGSLKNRLLLGGAILVTGLFIYVVSGHQWAKPHAHGLRIHSPANGDTVPRVMLAEGKVANAAVVWIVIRPVGHLDYYVQAPIKVADDGTWRGPIYTGGVDKTHIGVHVHLRAFVNPAKPLIEDQIIYAWPEAELSSDAIELVRGAQNIQTATP